MPTIVGATSLSTRLVPGFVKAFFRLVNETAHFVLSTKGSWNKACTVPPVTTPIAIARAGFAVCGAKMYVKAITIPLKRIGVKPEGEKIFTPFNIP